MFERPGLGERALLVCVSLRGDPEEERGELRELVTSAGARPVAFANVPRHYPDPRFFIGSGKVEELREQVRAHRADIVVFSHALNPAQERNLERALECRVLDRISLILDIFAQRATSSEGKLQVELAQLKHLSTRLVRGWTHLERQKGGIGLRGPGEKQLETDRRLVVERIKYIDRRLEGVRRRRDLSRTSRRKAGVPVVALVGYTNAGKSTLFNRLTGAHATEADRLFATLDPLLKRLELRRDCAAVMVDTVGFIRDLPHELIAAFRATLEETLNARLLLHVIDAKSEDRPAKIEQVNEVLAQLGAHAIPQIEVYNKIDAIAPDDEALRAGGIVSALRCEPGIDRDAQGKVQRVWVSAKTGAGMELLCDALLEHLGAGLVRHRVRVPAGAGRLRARLFECAKVLGERFDEDGDSIIDVEIAPAALERLCRAEGLDGDSIATQTQAPYHRLLAHARRA